MYYFFPYDAWHGATMRGMRRPVTSVTLLVDLPLVIIHRQYSQERLLMTIDGSHLLQPFHPLLLLLQQFTLPADISAVAFRSHIFFQSPDRIPCDHSGSDRRLDSHLILLSRDQLLELGAKSSPQIIGFVPVGNTRECVHRFTIQ